jgi:hypothetical protein
MSRAQSTFRQADLTKALKAAAAAGLHVVGFKIDKTAKIEVETEGLDSKAPAKEGGNEWDSI